MVSRATLTIVLGYAAAFWGLDLLSEAGKMQAPHGGVRGLAAGALLPAAAATFGLTSLLLHAYVRALGRADAGAVRRRFLDRLTGATLAAATAALLAGAVLRLGGAGADDVGWLKTTE